jgi:hypothetical protein
MNIDTLDFMYKAFIAVMFILVGYGSWLMYQDERSISKFNKENK